MSNLKDCMINKDGLSIIIADGRLVHLERHDVGLSVTDIFDIIAQNKDGVDHLDIKDLRDGAGALLNVLDSYGICMKDLMSQYVDEAALSHKLREMTGGGSTWDAGLHDAALETVHKKHQLSRAMHEKVTSYLAAQCRDMFGTFFDECGRNVIKSAKKFGASEMGDGSSWATHRIELDCMVTEFHTSLYDRIAADLIRRMCEEELKDAPE